MVYIVSIDSDNSTSDVIEWLYKLRKNYLRIGNLIDIKNKLDFFPVRLCNDNIRGDKANLSSVWIRRFSRFDTIADHNLQWYYWNESKAITDYALQSKLNGRSVLGVSSFGVSVNKLEMLTIAQKYGLLIPSTSITNSKGDVLQFHKEYKKIITKAMSEAFKSIQKGEAVVAYTKVVNKSFIKSLPDVFSTMLFQQYIEKEYEVRIFYLEGKLYPMAIFSQSSDKTKVDFRNYDSVNPSRTVPYKLPKNVEENLIRFMKDHKFDAASVDMVKCKNTGNHYFLEVNTHGQFGMVSEPCNYYLEKKLAETL
jgi:ATP-GRASP peptide maturase of grasp-with-spasm system